MNSLHFQFISTLVMASNMYALMNGVGNRRPSLRWDDEYLRFREIPINKPMVEKRNKSLAELENRSSIPLMCTFFGTQTVLQSSTGAISRNQFTGNVYADRPVRRDLHRFLQENMRLVVELGNDDMPVLRRPILHRDRLIVEARLHRPQGAGREQQLAG